MTKSKKITITLLVILLLAIVAGATLANFTTRKEFASVVQIGSVKVALQKFDVDGEKTAMMPGVPVTSTVAVQNVGSTDAYIRVSFIPKWKDGDERAISCELLGSRWREVQEKGKTYYYYEDPVPVKSVTSDLIGKVMIRGDLTGNEVAGQALDFDVKVEAIQAEHITLNFASSSVWPVADQDIVVNNK